MFSGGYTAQKLKTNLKLTINRLKLLEKKKTEQAQKARREVADYLSNGKDDRARIRVEHIIREDYLVEAMELVELYCDLLLARFGLIKTMKTVDEGLQESIASVIWVAPRMSTDVLELKVIAEQFRGKYGKEFFEICVADRENWVNLRLKHKLSVKAPAASLVENYLIEIARSHNVPYVPSPMAFNGEDMEQLLIDMDDKGKPPSGPPGGPSGGGGGGGGMPIAQMPSAPPPQPQPQAQAQAPTPYPPAVHPGMAYPPQHNKGGPPPLPCKPPVGGLPNGPQPPMGAAGGYPQMPNPLPPSVPAPPYEFHDSNPTPYPPPAATNTPTQPPVMPPSQPPTSQLPSDSIPNLPAVPINSFPPLDATVGGKSAGGEDVDFDDLTRRFEELKKKK
ncbi:IST1 homolog isoform X1 [Strongylocentrotus purpuratus]|uniref:IST1 homolog n=1 Tax=Strongylocentrotus purpuratus TaxID=7668 RepID=A0A7M7GFQ0_STRPU|nr:IST1 homolog isoform X1 [Strongylocentrotus purpuratus]